MVELWRRRHRLIFVSRMLCWLVVFWCMADVAESQEPASLTVYVQTIRGTNEEKPQERTWKRIGPKLSGRLAPIFQWKHYWQVGLTEVRLEPRRPRKIRLSDVRELELELVNGNDVEIRVFQKGKLTRRSRHKARSLDMEIIGGTRDDETSWFAVIRRDKPWSKGNKDGKDD